MSDVIVKEQPILNRILNKINTSQVGVQAYLLVGISDDDLKMYATLFSKVLICPKKYSNDCSSCNICKRISSNNFGELKIIEPVNGVIKKEEIINLRDSFQTNSIEGKNQVYIVHGVENLNVAAANSLLKFLEEPDSNTVAIFTTTNLNAVISTIVSRCQVIKLNNRTLRNGLEFVKNITNLEEEQINMALDFLFTIENNGIKAISRVKELFLDVFTTRENIKSALTVILLAYKDALNYKIFEKMEYYANETGIKNIADLQTNEVLIKKISFILENINKLEYNVNVTLFISNVLIGIGEITDGKGRRN